MKFENGIIKQIHLSFLPVSNLFQLEGDGIDLVLSPAAMQSLMQQIETLGCESIIENLSDSL